MKITNNKGLPRLRESTRTSREVPVSDAPTTASASELSGDLQLDVLKPAQAALAQLDEVDEARVAEIRAALAKGSIKFDAGKLAGLIQRYHGGKS
ncbi:MAG TPA: flagellar biosynthesis anti-sigma factor FlgM [Chromobacteriaceae bacterium]|nr:flagellar biosynthesis anti-sigma factor FlgM [Chromobacteriaceae bacterium]